MIGTWTYDASTGTGTGPAGTETDAQVLQAMNDINAFTRKAFYWQVRHEAAPIDAYDWLISRGDHDVQFATYVSEFTSVGSQGGVTFTETNNQTMTLDWKTPVMVSKSGNGTSVRVSTPPDGQDYDQSGEYSYLLNEDGTTSESGTWYLGYGGWSGVSFDAYNTVTEITVTATTIIREQVWDHNGYHTETVGSLVFTDAYTKADVMNEALGLLEERDIATVGAGAWFVKWVWGPGTPKAKAVTVDPVYADPNWPWAWRYWNTVSNDGYGYNQAMVASVRLPATTGEFGLADPDLKRSEQTVFTENTLPVFSGSYPDGNPPTWTGTFELIEGWVEIGETVIMRPILIGEDIPPSFAGYDFGKAELVPAT